MLTLSITLGSSTRTRKDFDRAEDVYLKLLALFPDHPDANYDLGYIYREKGLYDKALEQYKKALDINLRIFTLIMI